MQKLLIAILASSAAIAAAPAAASDEAGWTMTALENKKGKPWGAALIATSEDGGQFAFRCLDGALLVIAGLEDKDLTKAMTEAGPQKAVELAYAINDEEPVDDNWLYLRRHQAVASADPSVARPIYNAAVRGENVSIDAGRRGSGEFQLPAPDPDAFSAFRTTCGLNAKS